MKNVKTQLAALFLTGFCMVSCGDDAKAQCDMGDVNGCGPVVPTEVAQCDMNDRSCGPALPTEGKLLAQCDMRNEAGCGPALPTEYSQNDRGGSGSNWPTSLCLLSDFNPILPA